jgi:hypothetical protein
MVSVTLNRFQSIRITFSWLPKVMTHKPSLLNHRSKTPPRSHCSETNARKPSLENCHSETITAKPPFYRYRFQKLLPSSSTHRNPISASNKHPLSFFLLLRPLGIAAHLVQPSNGTALADVLEVWVQSALNIASCRLSSSSGPVCAVCGLTSKMDALR